MSNDLSPIMNRIMDMFQYRIGIPGRALDMTEDFERRQAIGNLIAGVVRRKQRDAWCEAMVQHDRGKYIKLFQKWVPRMIEAEKRRQRENP